MLSVMTPSPTLSAPREDAHIDAAALTADDLPPSYRAFIAEAGWGRTFGLWLILPPVLPGWADGLEGHGRALSDTLHASYAESRADDFDWVIEPDGSWELAERLVVFASSENGEVLAWDPAERRADGECPVYLSNRGQSLERVGSTLDEVLPILRERSPFSGDHDVEPLAGVRL